MSLVPGGYVEHYQLGEILGEDNLGRRFVATDTRDQRALVLLLLSEFLPHCGEDAVKGFLDEAKLAALVKQPGLIRPLRIGKAGERLYAVLPSVAGGTVAEDLAVNGPMTPREATRVLLEVSKLVVALHAGNVLHRDLRPENVVLGEDGQIWLAGAGFTRALEELQQFRLGVPVANPLTCAPELYRDGEADPRTDVYGLGVLYYFLLTARPPFQGDTSLQTLHKHCTEPVPDPRAINPVVTDDCVAVLERALAKAPADRYAKVEELIAALQELKQRLPGSSSSRQTRIPIGGQQFGLQGPPGSSNLSSSDIISASTYFQQVTTPSVGPGAVPSVQQLRPPTDSASSDELMVAGSGFAGSGLVTTTGPAPAAVSTSGSSTRLPVRSGSGPGSGARPSVSEFDAGSSRRRSLAVLTSSSNGSNVAEMSTSMPAIPAQSRRGIHWMLAILAMLVLGSITTVAVLLSRTTPTPELVLKKSNDVEVNTILPTDDSTSNQYQNLTVVTDTQSIAYKEEFRIPENPELPAPDDRVAMLAAPLAAEKTTPPGWTAQPTSAWSFNHQRQAAVGQAVDQVPARLSVVIPNNSFDLSYRIRIHDSAQAMLEFHHRIRGHLLLRLDSRGVLRLIDSSGETATENLDFKQLTLTEDSTHIRLLAEPGEVAVHVNGVPVMRSRGLSRADRMPAQLTFAVLGGRCEFSDLNYTPRTEKLDVRRMQTLELQTEVADPNSLNRVNEVLTRPTEFASALPTALALLRSRPEPQAEEMLRRLVSSPGDIPGSIVRQAVMLLGQRNSPESRALLEKMLGHPDPQYRRVAADAYSQHPAFDLDKLSALMQDESDDVARAVIAAIGRLGTDDAMNRIHSALGNPKLHTAAVSILLSRPDLPAGLSALLEGIESQDVRVRSQARDIFVTCFAELCAQLVQQIRDGKLKPATVAELRSVLSANRTRRWMVVGPFEPRTDLDGRHGPDYIERDSFMKRPNLMATYRGIKDMTVRWFGTSADGGGKVNLATVFNSKDRWLIYGYTTVYCDRECEHDVLLDCDDWMAIWINNKHIMHAQLNNKQKYKMKFSAGANRVFIVCDNRGAGEWFFKIGLPKDSPVPELTPTP